MNENTMRLAAAVVLMQHITMIGIMSANGALARAVFPRAAFEVSWMTLPIGCSDPPYGPSNRAATSPAVRQISRATTIQRIAFAEVDQRSDFGI